MGDNELGAFLRARRTALSPAAAGLAAGSRRRTPGLRRSEVATLAGVSVEYLIRLEQGRDRRPSAQVLSALADALQLTPNERVHLHKLARGADGGFLCTGGVAPLRTVRPTVRALLEHLEPAAAVLLNRLTDVVAHTGGFQRLFGPTGLLDGAPPNLARFVLTDDRARDAFPDWSHVADEQVATLKHGPFLADPHIAALVDELTVTAGAGFTRSTQTVHTLPRSTGVLRVRHPEAGDLRLAFETLDLPADDDQRLVVHLPADDATAAALDGLAHRRTDPLRVVSG